VLTRRHRLETFARYLIAVLRYHQQLRPSPRNSVDARAVHEAFAPELARPGRDFANDAWTLPDLFQYRSERLGPGGRR
jgi:hypothetical protein